MKITDYPVPAALDGSEFIPAMKDGIQVAIAPAMLAGSSAGAPGLSAYQQWRQAGNTGTVDDFLASLKGAPGKDGTGATNDYGAWG